MSRRTDPPAVPAPPVPAPPVPLPDPLEEIWPAGTPIVRCHPATRGSNELNPGPDLRRFRPFAAGDGQIIPTIYGSDTFKGAVSETVFHDVPVRGDDREIDLARLRPYLVSGILPVRDLRLASVRANGLRRLRVTHAELIETTAADYSLTVPWARAIWAHSARFDGLIWMSRQHNTSAAIMLFGRHDGSGVLRDELVADPDEPPRLICDGRGLDDVLKFAAECEIEVRGI
jgi:hypothetical protein